MTLWEKVTATEPDKLSSISGTHRVEVSIERIRQINILSSSPTSQHIQASPQNSQIPTFN